MTGTHKLRCQALRWSGIPGCAGHRRAVPDGWHGKASFRFASGSLCS